MNVVKKVKHVRFKIEENNSVSEQGKDSTWFWIHEGLGERHQSLKHVLISINELNYRCNGIEIGKISKTCVDEKIVLKTKELCNLYRLIQQRMDCGVNVVDKLALLYKCEPKSFIEFKSKNAHQKLIEVGFSLTSFLIDGGWFTECESVLWSMILSIEKEDQKFDRISTEYFDSFIQLLKVYNCSQSIRKCKDVKKKLWHLMNYFELRSKKGYNIIAAYIEFAHYYIMVGKTDECYHWCVLAAKLISPKTSVFFIIDLLRYSVKACIYRHEYHKVECLINQLLLLTKKTLSVSDWIESDSHPFVADVLLEYSYYLFKLDCVSAAVTVSRNALQIRRNVFERKYRKPFTNNAMNLQLAVTYYHTAYYEYCACEFENATFNINYALNVMNRLLCDDDLLLADARVVKALLLQEESIADKNGGSKLRKLEEAERLNLSALRVSKKILGEKNLRTANYYTNLGALHQLMGRFKDAKRDFKQAIKIQQLFLGYDAFEVGLSVGLLASLYSSSFHKYKKAESLYLKSLRIFENLFVETYSGFEHHFTGLINVYSKLGERRKELDYIYRYQRWRELRDKFDNNEDDNKINFEFVNSINMLNFENLKFIFE